MGSPVECKKRASSGDRALAVIGTLLSAFVSISPVMRVSKVNGQDSVVKYKWFMAFLSLVTLDYVAWVGYSFRGCRYCEAAVFMIINSMFGATVSCLWTLIGLVRDRGYVCDQEDKITLAICYASVVASVGYKSYIADSGYYALAGAVVAHLCRVRGTDYKLFSGPQFIVSLINGDRQWPAVHSSSGFGCCTTVLAFYSCDNWNSRTGVSLVDSAVSAFFTNTETLVTRCKRLDCRSTRLGWAGSVKLWRSIARLHKQNKQGPVY